MPDLIPVFDDHSYIMIDVLLDQAVGCPECYAHRKALRILSEKIVQSPRYVVACRECGYRGPFGKHICDAVRLWNKPPSVWVLFCKALRRRRQPRPPLTKIGAKA